MPQNAPPYAKVYNLRLTETEFRTVGLSGHYPTYQDRDEECAGRNQIVDHLVINDTKDGYAFKHKDEIK